MSARIKYLILLGIVAALTWYFLEPDDYIGYRVKINTAFDDHGQILIPQPLKNGEPYQQLIDSLAEQVLDSNEGIEMSENGIILDLSSNRRQRIWSGHICGRRILNGDKQGKIDLDNGFKDSDTITIQAIGFNAPFYLEVSLLKRNASILGCIDERQVIKKRLIHNGETEVKIKRDRSYVH